MLSRAIGLMLTGVALVATSGCATYEFNLTQPPELARHIDRKTGTTFTRGPLEYHLQSAEGRLVMQIHNTTEQPIQLLGSESYVVDPNSQSHPLRPQAIAPGAFIKLILPPPRPVYRASPSFGVGVGVGVGHYYHDPYYGYAPWNYAPWGYDPFWRDPWLDQPTYMEVDDPNDVTYWDWNGETAVRVRLVFRTAQGPLTHDFVFERQRMK